MRTIACIVATALVIGCGKSRTTQPDQPDTPSRDNAPGAGGMAATGQPAKPGTVTMANFHRVEKCTTQDEVLALLGQPTEAIGPQDLGEMKSTDSYKWVEGNKDLVVHFRRGRKVGTVAHGMP